MGRCGADFEVSGVMVLQQGMGTTPAVIEGHGGGEPGARTLILRSRGMDDGSKNRDEHQLGSMSL